MFGPHKNRQQSFVKRTPFPLTQSWGCTVQKVQGLSLTEGVVSLDLESQKCFNQGQMHVALSRITSINESSKREHARLRTESCFRS